MEIAIVILSFTIIINAFHISYIYKELSKRIDRERMLTTQYINKCIEDINYKNGIDLQNLINDIKSGKLKKEVKHKKKQN